MATRLATQSFVVGTTGNSAQARSGNISPDPSDECTSETSQTGLIIPGTTNSVELQQTIQQVAVIDVSALETSDASNESSVGTSSVQVATQVAVVQGQRDSHTPLLTASPHFITVTEGTVRSYAPLTTVNPVVPSEETVGTHSTYVQYVETTDLYGTGGPSQAQMAYPVYTVGGDYTSTAQQQYFGSATYAGAAATANATVTSGGHYIVPSMTADGETIIGTLPDSRSSPQANNVDVVSSYLNAAQPSSQDSEAVPLVNPTRVSPVTVQWLLSNYETAEGVSLPRSTLYAHYSRHCSENKIDPVNAASFGKLIRSVFMGLRTRRLGTRGNSKYHYYGIRIKPGSELNMLEESPSADSSFTNENTDCVPPGRPPAGPTKSQHRRPLTKADHYDGSAQYLGDGAHAIPSFPELEFKDELLPDDCSLDDVDTLRSIYREHCEAFLDAILGLEFNTIESLWREFWRSNNNNNGDECEEEKYLSKTKLYALCNCEPVQLFVLQIDYMFYQNIVEVLLPDVLRPIPSTLTQAIRNFAKGLENWLSAAMAGLPSALVEGKMTAVAAFGQTLRRYTSLNHLAQAARAVLQNGTQISQMLSDLNRVDFHNVQEQAAYVCQCDTIIVKALEEDFKYTLQQQNNLEQWATWLKTVMSNALQPFEGKPTYPKAARQFLLKWSFYSSMVIRDLTLRSAASFGSFHLIRLLYDEYMFYLVEHQIARSTGTTAIAVMAEVMRDQVSAHQFTPKPESPTGKRIRLS